MHRTRATVLAFKAEVVLAIQLVTRHRAPRLAALLALVVVVMLARETTAAAAPTLLLVAGSLAVAGASRLLAPGPALGAARRAPAPWWMVPCGRLVGLFLLVGAGVVVAGAILYSGEPARGMRALVVSTGFGTAVGAVTLALAPRVGASAAATLTFLPVWFGGLPPARVAELLGAWPRTARATLLLWHVLPLPWHAAALLTHGPAAGHAVHLLVLSAWALAALALAARSVARPAATWRRA